MGLEVNFVSDLKAKSVTGFFSAGGAALSALRWIGLLDEEPLVQDIRGNMPMEQMPLRPGDREDGGPETNPDFPDRDWEPKEVSPASTVLSVSGQDWACERLRFEMPWLAGFSFRRPIPQQPFTLDVWFSDDLQIVLKEELSAEASVLASYTATEIVREEPDPDLFVPFVLPSE